MLTSIDFKFIFYSARLGLFSPANILQIADVALRVVFLLFLPCFQLLFRLVLTLEKSEMSAIIVFTTKATQPRPRSSQQTCENNNVVYLFGPECIPLNEKWQKSFKADDSIDANNYRPISLLFKFNRIFEKLVFTRVKTSTFVIAIWLPQSAFNAACISRYSGRHG